MPPGCWERWRGSPAISRASDASARKRRSPARSAMPGSCASSSLTFGGAPAVGGGGEPRDVGRRQAEHLAELADRAARAVGGERADQRRVPRRRSARARAGSGPRGCRAGSRGRCRAPRPARGSGTAPATAPTRPGRRGTGRSGSRRSSRRSSRGRAPAAAASAASRAPRTSSATSRAISSTSWCSRKKPDSRWWRISASSSSSRARASAACCEPARVPLVEDVPRSAAPAPGRARRRWTAAGSRGRASGRSRCGRRSRRWPRSPRARRRTAPPSRPARFSTCSRLPRRSASQASSVACTRIATSASCSGPRRRLWTCTSLVATTGSPSRRASARRARMRAWSPRWNGRCSSTQSRPSKASAELPHRSPRPRPRARAQPVRQSSPSASSQHVVELGHRLVGRAVGAVAGAGVGAGDQLAEVLVAAPLLDQQRQVAVLAGDLARSARSR